MARLLSRADRLTVKVAGAATLAPLSVLLQSLPPVYLTPWFMRIDLVAIPWMLCWMLFGFKAALLCMAVSAPIVGILGPFAGGWVGAIMKSAASIWMIAIPELFRHRSRQTCNLFQDRRAFTLSTIASIAVRDVATLLFNFYFALPVFFGMSPDQILSFFTNPRSQSFVGSSLGAIGVTAFVIEIVFWNTIQGLIDAYVSLAAVLVTARRLFGRHS